MAYSYDILNGVTKIKTKLAIAITSLSLLLGGGGLSLALLAPAHAVDGCTPTGFYRDGMNLTAKQINPGVITGIVDAGGCNIGVYFGPNSGGFTGKGVIKNAEIYGANYFGVVVQQAKVDVSNSNIHDIRENPADGAQHGVGLYYANVDGLTNGDCTESGSTSGKISKNEISQYQKGGIAVACAKTNVMVTDNEVTGLDTVPFIAQNGIQFGYGASGQARDNTVTGNWYTGASWASTGILIFESDNVIVQKNEVNDSQIGIGVETWCYLGVPTASNNNIDNNTVNGSDYGVSVAAYSYISECNASANDNKVVNNKLVGSGQEDGTGVYVGSYIYSVGFSPEAKNNKVIHNQISNFDVSLDTGMSSTPKVHANVLTP